MRRTFREIWWLCRASRHADQAIVRLLTSQMAEMSGGAIGAFLCMSPVTLYPALYRLEVTDMIASRWEIMPTPRRRLYRVAD